MLLCRVYKLQFTTDLLLEFSSSYFQTMVGLYGKSSTYINDYAQRSPA